MLKHFDHVTVAVTDPAAAIGFFHDCKLVFLEGPDGIAVELAEWK